MKYLVTEHAPLEEPSFLHHFLPVLQSLSPHSSIVKYPI